MQIVTNYLKKNLFINFLIMMLFFGVLVSVMQFVSQMKSIGEGNYGLLSAIWYVLLLLPRNIYKLSPIIMVVAVAYSSFKLRKTNELVAVGATGLSNRAILSSLLNMSVLVVLVFFVLGEGLGPWFANAAKNNRMHAITSGRAFSAGEGVWLHEDNWYVNIATIVDGKHFADITKYQVENGDLKRIEYAKHASYKDNGWILKDIVWTDFTKNKTSSGHADSLLWHSELDSSIVKNLNTLPARQSLWNLAYSLSSGLDIGTNNSISEYIFWQRLFYPFALFFMLMFVTGRLFSITEFSKNNMLVVAFVLFYYFAPDYLLSLSFYGVPPLLAALLLPGISLSVCYVFMRRNVLD